MKKISIMIFVLVSGALNASFKTTKLWNDMQVHARNFVREKADSIQEFKDIRTLKDKYNEQSIARFGAQIWEMSDADNIFEDLQDAMIDDLAKNPTVIRTLIRIAQQKAQEKLGQYNRDEIQALVERFKQKHYFLKLPAYAFVTDTFEEQLEKQLLVLVEFKPYELVLWALVDHKGLNLVSDVLKKATVDIDSIKEEEEFKKLFVAVDGIISRRISLYRDSMKSVAAVYEAADNFIHGVEGLYGKNSHNKLDILENVPGLYNYLKELFICKAVNDQMVQNQLKAYARDVAIQAYQKIYYEPSDIDYEDLTTAFWTIIGQPLSSLFNFVVAAYKDKLREYAARRAQAPTTQSVQIPTQSILQPSSTAVTPKTRSARIVSFVSNIPEYKSGQKK